MAVNTYTISSANDLKAVLESHPPFNTDAYTVNVDTDAGTAAPRVVVYKNTGGSIVCTFLMQSGETYYTSATSFSFVASSSKTISVVGCISPKIAVATSKGVIISSNATPSSLNPTSTAGSRYFSVLLGNDKNGKPAVACQNDCGVHNIGCLKSAAMDETSDDINNWSVIIRNPDSSSINYQFPRRSDQVMVTAPIATHPSTGTNTIDGGLLFIQCPVIPLGVVRIGNKNYATNGIMAISD